MSSIDAMRVRLGHRITSYERSQAPESIVGPDVVAELAEVTWILGSGSISRLDRADSRRIALSRAAAWLRIHRHLLLPGDEGLAELAEAIRLMLPYADLKRVVPRPLHQVMGDRADFERQWHLVQELISRGEVRNDRDMIDVSVDLVGHALSRARLSEAERALLERLSSVAHRSRSLVNADRRAVDSDRSVQDGEAALRRVAARGPARLLVVFTLGLAYLTRFQFRDVSGDYDRAVGLLEEALGATSVDDPEWVTRVRGMASALRLRYERTGTRSCLDRTVELLTDALSRCARDGARCASVLATLGPVLLTRYAETGRVADLDRATACGEQAVRIAPADGPEYVEALSLLASAFHARYERDGESADLDRGVACAEEALAKARGTSGLPAVGATSALLMEARFVRDGRPQDLARAIDLGTAAVADTPEHDPQHAAMLGNLGACRMMLYTLSRDPADLEHAVALANDALRATGAGSPHLPGRLSDLCSSRLARYRQTRLLSDLDASVELGERAVRATPVDGAQRSRRIANLAQALVERWGAGARAVDRELTDRLAAGDEDGPVDESPTDRVRRLHTLGILASAAGRYAAAARLLGEAAALLPAALPVSAARMDREVPLTGFQGLAAGAVVAHCRLGEPARALVAAERGRAVLMSISAGPRSGQGARSTEGVGVDRVLSGAQLDRLRPVAAHGTVVLVAPGLFDGGHAVVLGARGEPVSIALPGLSRDEVERRVGTFLRAQGQLPIRAEQPLDYELPALLSWLWTGVAEPVLDVVRRVTGTSLPRVWWMPVGLLGLLPLHAAGGPGEPGCLDAAVSSYAPTLRLASCAGAAPPTGGRRRLVIAVPEGAGGPELPGARAEAQAVPADLPTLTNPDRAEVRAALLRAGWVHFACHASLDPRSPSAGGLHLRDGLLSVADIQALDLTGTELAYLSACSTGQSGWRYVDEALHPASAFRLAGFRHVVAGLWPVNDRAGLWAARLFYRRMGDAASADGAAEALRFTTMRLRERYADHPRMWAGFVHSGP